LIKISSKIKKTGFVLGDRVFYWAVFEGFLRLFKKSETEGFFLFDKWRLFAVIKSCNLLSYQYAIQEQFLTMQQIEAATI
jgi:hypothetical protein